MIHFGLNIHIKVIVFFDWFVDWKSVVLLDLIA